MNLKWLKIVALFFIFIVIIFYLGKREQINNILSPYNTSIEVIENSFDFGDIKLGDTIKHTYIVRNVGKKDLTIQNVQADCECTITSFDKKPIKINEMSKVSVIFIPTNTGITDKNILIEANTVPPFTVLNLKGKVN